MIHAIEQYLIAIGQHARRLLIGYATAWVTGVAIMAVMLLGLADFLFHFDDRGVRLIAMLLLVAVITWAVVRFLRPALRYRPNTVQLAQRIEQLHPELRGRLASTIEFLHQPEDDPTAGSAELRRITIAETDAAVDGLNWSAAVDSRPTKRAAIIAGTIAGFALIVIAILPVHSSVAVLRLVNPLGNSHWPRNNYLVVREPVERIASGQAFAVEVIDESGKLPEEVYIQYRWHAPGEPTIEEQEKMEFADGAMTARRDGVTRKFEFRAVGGDDDTMSWNSVELVEPPRIESARFTVKPPPYTGYAPYESPDRIEAIVGSTVTIKGQVTKPLAAAALRWSDDVAQAAVLSADGTEFAFPADSAVLQVRNSGHYKVDLTDRDSLTTEGIRGDIRAITDSSPTVSLDRPAAGLFATPSASVPIKAVAKDNLAIRSVALVYSRTDKSDVGDQRIELLTGLDSPTPQLGATPVSAAGESKTIDERWELLPLNLPPGTQLTFHIAADDYQPKTGVSTARKITIVTATELEERIGLQQASILAELARILNLEREIHSHTAGAREQLSQVGKLPTAGSDQLQTSELNQRQVRRALTSNTDGILSQIASLMSELESNRLDSPGLSRRLEQMQAAIEQLENGPLPLIERELTTAVKESKSLAGEDAKPSTVTILTSLNAASGGESEVIVALEKLIDELTEWSHYRGLARDIGQIRQEQAALQKLTQDIGSATIALDAQSLSAQQRADISGAARVQGDLAGRFSKVLTQMDRLLQQSTDDHKSSTEAVGDALHLARQHNLAGQMRDGADHIAGNRIGQSLERQAAVLRGLDEMLDALANRREQELSHLVKKLRDAEQQLEELRNQQLGLQKKLERLTKESKEPGADQQAIKRELERLQREQRRLQEETQRLTRQLERLQADKASKSTAGAGDRMEAAENKTAANKPGEALDEATKAKEDLDEAQKQLAEQRKKAEQDLANEQLAKIGDALKSLADRQSQVIEETRDYETRRDKTIGFTRAQSQSILDLSRSEAGLSSEAAELAEKVAAAEVFNLALTRTAAEMTGAAERLAKVDTGDETQRSASDALRRLQQIIEALKRDPNSNSPKPNDGGGGGGGSNNQPLVDKIALLAEVKLLKMMQEQVNLRTRELDEAAGKLPMLTADLRREYIELAKEQGKLAELILKKSAPLDAPAEDDPDALPDLRPEEKKP
jgi:hypothetical protein